MESSGSCSAIPANMSLALAIRDEDNELSGSATSSRVPSSAAKNKALAVLVEGAFKCKVCSRAFKNALARAGHQKAHRQPGVPPKKKKKKNKKASKGRRPVPSPPSIWPCSYATALRSACLRAQPIGDWRSHFEPSVLPVPPSFPWLTLAGTSTGSLAAPPEAGGIGDGGRLLLLQDVPEVSQEEPADGIDLTLRL